MLSGVIPTVEAMCGVPSTTRISTLQLLFGKLFYPESVIQVSDFGLARTRVCSGLFTLLMYVSGKPKVSHLVRHVVATPCGMLLQELSVHAHG